MPEPITTIGLGAIAAYLGKRWIGETARPDSRVFGIRATRIWLQRRIHNIGRIFRNAPGKTWRQVRQAGRSSTSRPQGGILRRGIVCCDDERLRLSISAWRSSSVLADRAGQR